MTAAAPKMPAFIAPQLPGLVDTIPVGPGWVHEVKHDDYRILAVVRGSDVRLMSRHRKDYTADFRGIAHVLTGLRVREAIIDGELAAPDENGVTRVADMRHAIRSEPERLAFYAFDLLWLDTEGDLRARPLLERKWRLKAVLKTMPHPRILYSAHVPGREGPALYHAVTALGAEGIVSKRTDALYRSGRSRTWVKTKPEAVRARQTESAASRVRHKAGKRGTKR